MPASPCHSTSAVRSRSGRGSASPHVSFGGGRDFFCHRLASRPARAKAEPKAKRPTAAARCSSRTGVACSSVHELAAKQLPIRCWRSRGACLPRRCVPLTPCPRLSPSSSQFWVTGPCYQRTRPAKSLPDPVFAHAKGPDVCFGDGPTSESRRCHRLQRPTPKRGSLP